MSNSKSWLSPFNAILLVAIAAACCGLYYQVLAANPRTVDFDEKTLCRTDRRSVWTTVILVDLTDPVGSFHLARFEERLRDVRRRAPIGGRIVVLAVDPANPYSPQLLADRCNPGRGKEVDRYIDESEVDADKRWIASFDHAFDSVLAMIRSYPPSPRSSPIIESIVGVTLRPDFDRSVSSRLLVVFSDGLQKVEGYSHYVTSDRWKSFERSPMAIGPQPDLSGVAIVFEYIIRTAPKDAKYQTRSHREFWRRWFDSQHVASIEFAGVIDAASR